MARRRRSGARPAGSPTARRAAPRTSVMPPATCSLSPTRARSTASCRPITGSSTSRTVWPVRPAALNANVSQLADGPEIAEHVRSAVGGDGRDDAASGEPTGARAADQHAPAACARSRAAASRGSCCRAARRSGRQGRPPARVTAPGPSSVQPARPETKRAATGREGSAVCFSSRAFGRPPGRDRTRPEAAAAACRRGAGQVARGDAGRGGGAQERQAAACHGHMVETALARSPSATRGDALGITGTIWAQNGPSRQPPAARTSHRLLSSVTPDTDKLVRQLSLVAYLMAERRSASARDVKQAVEGYSEMSDEAFARRFYADRSELLALGVPLQSQRDDFTGEELYTLLQEHYFLPPLNLNDAELAALSTAVHLLDGQFAYAEPLRLALQNLALGRPNPSYDAAPEVSVRLLGTGFTAEVAVRLQKLETAISKQRTVVFRYWAISSDEEAVRTVDPYSLYLMGGHWYVIGRDHDRDDVRTFRLDRVRGDVRFATRRERDFRVPPGVRPERLPQPRALAARRGRRAGDDPRRARGRLAGRARRRPVRHDRAPRRPLAALHDAVADWQELARWLIGLDGLASPLSPPELVERVAAALERVAADHEGEPPPHAVPLELVDRAAAPERGESPVTPGALRRAPGHARRRAGGLRRAQGRDTSTPPSWPSASSSPTRSSRITCSCSTSSTSAAAATPSTPSASTTGARSTSRRSSTATSSAGPPGSRRSRPRRCCSRSTSSARSWPPTPARRSTTCAPSSRPRSAATTCAGAPTPQPTPLDEDVLSVLSAAVRSRTVVEIEYLGAPGRRGHAARGRAALPARRARRLVLRHLGSHARRRAHVPRRPHPRGARAGRDVRAAREPDGARRRRARRPRRHGLVLVLGRASRAGSSRTGPTPAAWPTAPRSHRCRTAPSAGSAPSSAATSARPCCSSPSRCAPGSRARARELAALVRSHATASTLVSAAQARWLSDAQVAELLPAPAEAAELARSVLVGLAEGTIELPPKPAIHPRPDAFVNTMPAYVGGLDGSGRQARERLPGQSRARAAGRSRRS